MKTINKLKLPIVLLLASSILYAIHYQLFHDFHHVAFYLMEDLAFIPIEVIFVSLIIHKAIEDQEREKIREKTNVLVSVFFSEAGNGLLKELISSDDEIHSLKSIIEENVHFSPKELKVMRDGLNNHSYKLNLDSDDLCSIKDMIASHKGFILNLIQNPHLIEHDGLTDLILAMLHLIEELGARKDLDAASREDVEHLTGDVERVYSRLAKEWLSYMGYQKKEYPFLFSFATRSNPFSDENNIEF
ncbi:hypothetical protein SAMN02745751_02093 [Dethiosulfatibacter aminovorans DSM 17477]|uniref:Uncharacterized protein n=1 Tax=Dethiosulfatibacter aminovorans DSM 17477 TaxID=1121476 RepID=A0A1M6HSZ4_9FIRM|nr:hypothetical protein [Dethiosulfatibacter aminovorans]SHJ25244.1 hypothetical protein SAMN02745751_02093 [Dethiosulfatibacter aminovorans DSM 17477]